MDQPALSRLISEHGRFPATLQAVAAGLDDPMWRARETPERWSPLEIVRHLLDEEREDFLPRAKAAVAGGEFPSRINPQAWVTERAYNEADPQETMAAFAAEREASCEWLRTLAPANLGKTLTAKDGFAMKAGDFVAAWRIHDLLHLRQITAAIATLEARRLSPWQVDYAGDIPYLKEG
ncbi:DinB family protein [bacterium]|nr:DinB family protein [bacterium]